MTTKDAKKKSPDWYFLYLLWPTHEQISSIYFYLLSFKNFLFHFVFPPLRNYANYFSISLSLYGVNNHEVEYKVLKLKYKTKQKNSSCLVEHGTKDFIIQSAMTKQQNNKLKCDVFNIIKIILNDIRES